MFRARHGTALVGWQIRLPSSSPYISVTARHLPKPTSQHYHQRRHQTSTATPHQPFPNVTFSTNGYAKFTSEPLRILFCGSDNFSIASLRALYALMQSDPSLIESIDVLVRPGKPAGRGMKLIRNVPLYYLAKDELGLPVHERDTFRGWILPYCGHIENHWTGEKDVIPHPTNPKWTYEKLGNNRPVQKFNMVIAVSFGLFVPPRILDSLKYGGLNLHPSLLPDLPGAAPIQWTILAKRPVTGVTLQTLHPAEYDRGVILAQTSAPGIPVPEDATAGSLLHSLADEGANMLVQGLKQNLHVPPYDKCEQWFPPPSLASSVQIRDAPKLTNHYKHIDWRCRFWGADKTLYPSGRLTASDIVRAARAMTWKYDGPGKDTENNHDSKDTKKNDNDKDNKKKGSKASGGLQTHALLVLYQEPRGPISKSGKVRRVKSDPREMLQITGGSSSTSSSSPIAAAAAAAAAASIPVEKGPFVKPNAPLDRRILLGEMEAVPCPAILRDAVRSIIQIRRCLLLMDAEKEFGDEEREEGEQEQQQEVTSKSTTQEALHNAIWFWEKEDIDTSSIGCITLSTPEDLNAVPNPNATHEAVRLPVLVDSKDASVTIPIGVPYITRDGFIKTDLVGEEPINALKINMAKVAGSTEQPAAVALRPFLQLPLSADDICQEEYAVDVMARSLD